MITLSMNGLLSSRKKEKLLRDFSFIEQAVLSILLETLINRLKSQNLYF